MNRDAGRHLQQLICIAGSPRSGTTWVGKSFDSHPATLYRHEPDSTYRHEELPLIVPRADYERWTAPAVEYLDKLVVKRDSKTSGILPVFRKRYYNEAQYQLRRHAVLGVKLLKRAGPDLDVPDLVDCRDPDEARLAWKTIESLGRVGLLAHAVPGARFVHVVRHPCGHIASTLRGEAQRRFTSQSEASEDLGMFAILLRSETLRSRGIDEAAVHSMSPVERLASRWLAMNEELMRDTAGRDNVHSVAYEAICDDPLGQYRALFEFCGLDWNAQTEEFLHTSTSRDSSGYYSVVKDPAVAANRWRDELDQTQADEIRAVVADSLPWRLFAGRE